MGAAHRGLRTWLSHASTLASAASRVPWPRPAARTQTHMRKLYLWGTVERKRRKDKD